MRWEGDSRRRKDEGAVALVVRAMEIEPDRAGANAGESTDDGGGVEGGEHVR